MSCFSRAGRNKLCSPFSDVVKYLALVAFFAYIWGFLVAMMRDCEWPFSMSMDLVMLRELFLKLRLFRF
jgi:hypothetical protein